MNRAQMYATLELLGYKRVGHGLIKFMRSGAVDEVRQYVWIDHGTDSPRYCYGDDQNWNDPIDVEWQVMRRIFQKVLKFENDGVANGAN